MQGAQRELMKYWSRVSGNRWLVAKMFGVLMVGFDVFEICSRVKMLINIVDLLSSLGSYCRLNGALPIFAKQWRLGMHYPVASIGQERFV